MSSSVIPRRIFRTIVRRRACIGIGVGATTVRVLLMRDGKVQWKDSRSAACSEDLIASLSDMLARVPRSRQKGLRAIAALGPHHAQVKALHNLPAAARNSWLNAVVRENGERFFLRSANATMSSRLYVDGRGTTWGAAMDGTTLDAVLSACRSVGIALVGVVPSAWILPYSADDDRLEWLDAGARVSVETTGGEPVAIRRTRAAEHCAAAMPTQLPAELLAIGPDAWEFADAYGALASQDNSPLSIDLRSEAHDAHDSRRRTVALVAFVVAALIHLAAGPVLVARLVADRVTALDGRTTALAAESRRLIVAMRATTTTTAELQTFRRTRTSIISLLGVLSDVLPEDADAASARMRNGQGSADIGAADASAVIEALQQADSIGDVQVDGPVTSDIQNGTRRERIAVRFRWNSGGGSQQETVRAERGRD